LTLNYVESSYTQIYTGTVRLFFAGDIVVAGQEKSVESIFTNLFLRGGVGQFADYCVWEVVILVSIKHPLSYVAYI